MSSSQALLSSRLQPAHAIQPRFQTNRRGPGCAGCVERGQPADSRAVCSAGAGQAHCQLPGRQPLLRCGLPRGTQRSCLWSAACLVFSMYGSILLLLAHRHTHMASCLLHHGRFTACLARKRFANVLSRPRMAGFQLPPQVQIFKYLLAFYCPSGYALP